MTVDDTIIFIIDDDPSVRKSLARLLSANGYLTETFASLTDFLRRDHHWGAGCVVLDIYMPEISGLEGRPEAVRSKLPSAHGVHHGVRRCPNQRG